jgi:hypothetical protein
MSRWFRFNFDMLRDVSILRLNAREFRQKFNEALDGQENEFSPFIKGPFSRPPAHEWVVIRGEVFERDNYTCTYCGAHGVALECDHIVPVAKGGTHDPDNLTTACRSCNRSKRDKLIEEWRR